jgi:hypothetical protein
VIAAADASLRGGLRDPVCADKKEAQMTTTTDVVTDLINVGTIHSQYVFVANATETIDNGTTSWAVTESRSTYNVRTNVNTRFQVDSAASTSVEVANYSTVTHGFGSNTPEQVVAYDDGNVLLNVLNGDGSYSNTWYVVSDSRVLNAGTITDMSTTGSYTSPPPACYVKGTRIRTAGGDVAVETLVEGDRVSVYTQNGGGEQPVVWVGRRRVDIAGHPDPEAVLPIRIRRGAFDRGEPSRDLLVSPDHAIYLDGLLIPAKLLINGGSIVQEAGWRSVVYYHVELPEHSVVYAEGLRAESYLDTGNRSLFENGSALMMLHPDFSISARLMRREDGSCAPFVVAPSILQPIWQALAQRSDRLGYPVVTPDVVSDPELRLRTATRELRPLSVSHDKYVFLLPANTDEVMLVSRAARPNQTRPWLDDGRRLGVRVGRIIVKDNSYLTEVPLDSPALGSGWWAIDGEGQSLARWTNGSASLVLPPGHGRLLELQLAGSMTYPITQEDDVLSSRIVA